MCPISGNLKKLLITDWDNITRKQMLMPICGTSKFASAPVAADAADSADAATAPAVAPVSVQQILEMYRKSKEREDDDSSSISSTEAASSNDSGAKEQMLLTNEVCAGVKNYFDKALGTILLYKFERAQYDAVIQQGAEAVAAAAAASAAKTEQGVSTIAVVQQQAMSAVYGAEHLLRLFGE